MLRPTASQPQARAQWLAETVRRAEEQWGPYEDAAIVRDLVARPPASHEPLVIARQLAVAQREGLTDSAHRWVANAWAALAVLALIALLTGWGAARGALGDGSHPVNLFWALGTLLALNLATFVVWGISMLVGERSGLVGRVVVWLAGRLTRLPRLTGQDSASGLVRPTAALLPVSLLALLRRARLQRVLFGLLTHAWWTLVLATSVVALIVLLSTRRYEFLWETTLLSPDTFVSLTRFLGYLPARLGFAIPDAAMVRASDGLLPLGAEGHALWSTFLLGCVVVYGVLPRMLALLACAWLVWRRRHGFAVDLGTPSLVALEQRLQQRAADIGVVDAERDIPQATGPASAWAQEGCPTFLSEDLRRHTARDAAVVVGIELPHDVAWPPAWVGDGVLDGGNIDDRHQRNALLGHLAQHRPQRLLLVCDVNQTPDRGTLALITELMNLSASGRILLLAMGSGPQRFEQWQVKLLGAGIGNDRLINGPEAAMRWLAPQPA